MQNIKKLISARRSVRTFDDKQLTSQDLEKLNAFMAKIENPYNLPIEFRLMDAKKNGLSCPVVVGTDLYVGGKMKQSPHFNEAFGYAFETLVLYAQSLGIGTVWIGGTMDRSAFERAMELSEDEVMPCVSPLGYPAQKMSLRETMMRKGVKAEARLPFEELFFDGSFDVPMSQERADKLCKPLEMVRLSPSAVNKQPWRIVVKDNFVHFYLKRSKGFVSGGNIDMQKIDIGIALCHFSLTAEESGLNLEFICDDPKFNATDGLEYISSYRVLQ